MTLDAEMASLNVALTLVALLTLVASLAGVTVRTVGGVVSGSAVVKDHVWSEARAFPEVSLIPPEPDTRVAV